MNYQQHALDYQINSMILDNALEKYSSVVKIPISHKNHLYSFAEDGSSFSLSSIFSGIGSSISSFVSSHIDTSSISGFLKSLSNILIPGALWSRHPFLAGLVTIAGELGYPIGDVLEKVFDYVKSAFLSGVSPSIDKALSFLPKTASENNLFEIIRYSCSDNTIIKVAVSNSFNLYSNGESGIFKWVGDFLRKILFIKSDKDGFSKNEKFGFSTVLGWAIKGILLASITSWGIGKLKGETSGETSSEKTPPAPTLSSFPSTPKPAGLIPSGKGEILHNQGGSRWMMRIPAGQNIQEMLLGWIHEIYDDQLNKYEESIIDSNSFNNVAKNLRGPGSTDRFIYIPTFTSKRQIVDAALSDTFSEINKTGLKTK